MKLYLCDLRYDTSLSDGNLQIMSINERILSGTFDIIPCKLLKAYHFLYLIDIMNSCYLCPVKALHHCNSNRIKDNISCFGGKKIRVYIFVN